MIIDGIKNHTIESDFAEPQDMVINEETNTVYIVKSDYEDPKLNGYVSVLNGTTDKIIKEIEVGAEPEDIELNKETNTLYVSDSNANSISIIEGNTNNLIAGVIFQITPPNSGEIVCNGLTPSTNRYIMLFSNTECVARPGKGFEFNSWSQNMEDNSSRIIQLVPNSNSFINSILDSFGIRPLPQESNLRITKFSSFTANFRELSPPIPPEYLLGLYTIAATVFTGWFVPNIARYISNHRQKQHMIDYFDKLNMLQNKNEDRDVEDMRKDIMKSYARGEISESHYNLLIEKIKEMKA